MMNIRRAFSFSQIDLKREWLKCKAALHLPVGLYILHGFFLTIALFLVLHMMHVHSGFTMERDSVHALIRKSGQSHKTSQEKKLFELMFQNAQSYFLQKHVEELPLLVEEKERLLALASHPAFADAQSLHTRIADLESDRNRLHFAEDHRATNPFLVEVVAHQEHPVEVDRDDLMKILSIFERKQIGPYEPDLQAPHLMITKFQLRKIKRSEHFSLMMHIVKKEIQHDQVRPSRA